jgi:hypothetical protein
MNDNKIKYNGNIKKISVIELSLENTYLLEINRNYKYNFKKQVIILFINPTLNDSYRTNLYYKIYHDIDLSKTVVLLITSFNKKYPYINFIRLTYNNFFNHISKKSQFGTCEYKSLIAYYSEIFKTLCKTNITLELMKVYSYFNFNLIDFNNIKLFLSLNINRVLNNELSDIDLKLLWKNKNNKIKMNGFLIDSDDYKISKFYDKINFGNFIPLNINDYTPYNNIKEYFNLYLFPSINNNKKIMKIDISSFNNELKFLNGNIKLEKEILFDTPKEYFILDKLNNKKFNNNEKIIIDGKEFNIFYNKNTLKNHDIVKEILLKDLNCIKYDNLDIYKCNNILNKTFKLLKYVNYNNISNLSIIKLIVLDIISKCKEKYEKNKNNYSLKIINIISKQFNRMNLCNHYNNKHFCTYINRITNNVLQLYDCENKINDKNLNLNNIIKNHNFENSCNFFTSVISFSDWYEELEMNSCMGVICKIETTILSSLGYCTDFKVNNITSTFYPCNDFLNICEDFYKENSNISNKLFFKGNAVGDGNCIIPLYIHKENWIIAKKKLKYLLGIIMSNNPAGFVKYHYKFMFKFLLDYCNTITYGVFLENNNVVTNKYLTCFWAYFRTVAQLSFDHKYNRGIRTIVNKYLNNPSTRKIKNEYDYLSMLGQIICTGYILSEEESNNIVLFIIDEIIYFKVNKNERDILINKVFKNDSSLELIKDYVDDLINYYYNILEPHIKYLYSFLIFNKILRSYYLEFKNYNNFIKILDSNYSVIPEKYNIIFKNKLLKEIENIKKNDFKDINLDTLYFIIYKLKKCYRIVLYDTICKNINLKIKNVYECDLNSISNLITIKMVDILHYQQIKEKTAKEIKDTLNNKTHSRVDDLVGAGGRL